MASVDFSLAVGVDHWAKNLKGSVGFETSIMYGPYLLATGAADTSLPFGSVVTASVVYLNSDQALTLKLNSNSGTSIALSANRPFFAGGVSVTAVYLSNSSGSTANITALIAGAGA